MDPVVEAGIIGGGSAVAASLITGALAIAVTRTQLHAAQRSARIEFLAERQADLYVELGELAERMRVMVDIFAHVALGLTPARQMPPPVSDERWFAFQGRLRVFGSRIARDTFQDLQTALERVQAMAASAATGKNTPKGEVDVVVATAGEAISRIRTVASAEVGPLRDMLEAPTMRRWPFRR